MRLGCSVTSYGYDIANRTTDVWHETSGAVTLGRYQYSYDGASNVLTRTDNDGSVTTFGYDGSDQLTSEVRSITGGGSNPYSIAYTYDHNANRKTKVLNGVTDTYTLDSNDKLLSTSSKTYGYDLNGNCTSVKVGAATPTLLTYDIENRVTGITYPAGGTNSFVYNGEDLLTKKTDSAGTKTYKTDGSSPASPVLSDGAATYTPGLSERRGTTSSFYHSDALGSTRGITGNTQAATDSTLYDGFGMTVSRTGTTPTPFGFVGASQYQTDTDSGLQLLGHRYYDPSIGRFISSDPAKAGTNWYVYCNNKPLSAIDPKGLRLIPPSDPAERRDFYIALWYLSIDPEYRRMIRELERSPVDHRIRIVHDGDDHFDPNDNSIQWDPNSALRTTDGGRQTPALGLGHEMDHAWGSDNGLPPAVDDTQYKDTEERRVISGRERRAAGRFGESPRSNHGDLLTLFMDR